jgi:hypothetical protein
MATKYLEAGAAVPECRKTIENAGKVMIELYAPTGDDDGSFTDVFSDDRDEERAVTADWIGASDSRLAITFRDGAGQLTKIREYPRERVCYVERRTIAHEGAHDWDPVNDPRRYLDRYGSEWAMWCERCDTVREATPGELKVLLELEASARA